MKQTFGIKEQLRIGAQIADQMPKFMGLQECADKLGISDQLVRNIECQALFKISRRLKEMVRGGEV